MENKDHNCKDHVDTIWKWDIKTDDYQPVEDICLVCGETIYEY